ncbi:hypothetical protein ACL02R_08375 [Streptomyces sp. MS19]|uniref:hypothetical protein n=1 Tax=Streptomyces sp. MS19 TaxID=3385972 RepID=UPI00399F604A
MRVGITGHRGLSEQIERQVREELKTWLTPHADDLVGVSCIADGPDAWFAETVLALGGRLEVVIPATTYRAGLPQWHHPVYDELMRRASDVHTTGLTESDSQAHMAGSEILAGLTDHLIAVWDGLPARGHGGTTDVVTYARHHNVPVTILWPPGATRD